MALNSLTYKWKTDFLLQRFSKPNPRLFFGYNMQIEFFIEPAMYEIKVNGVTLKKILPVNLIFSSESLFLYE